MSTSSMRGLRGEAMALLFLEDCGYRCLAKRFRLPGGEIDLVMEGPGVVVFVEVKVSGPGGMGEPCERVTRRKLALLRKMASRYLLDHPRSQDVWIRFDVVGIKIEGDGEGMLLNHLSGIG